jgi:hypothetical protein
MARGRVVLTSDVTNSAAAFADVTGLSFTLTVGYKYLIRARLITTGTATTGVVYGLNASPSTAPTLMGLAQIIPTTATTNTICNVTAFDTGTASTDILAAGSVVTMEGIIVPAATQIAIVRIKPEGAVATTCKAGSFIDWEEL